MLLKYIKQGSGLFCFACYIAAEVINLFWVVMWPAHLPLKP